jgi:hypothetical protein
MRNATTGHPGHDTIDEALADHARRRAAADLVKLRPWCEDWRDDDGNLAHCGECPVCGSTLTVFLAAPAVAA